MNKVFGISGLLLFVCVFTAIFSIDFLQPYNLQNNLRWIALFGIISVGVAFVIITGGIDLSIGSVIGLMGVVLAMLLTVSYHSYNGAAVIEVSADDRAVRVQGDAGESFQLGDQVLYIGGRTRTDALFTVGEMASQANVAYPGEDAGSGPATVVAVSPRPELNDSEGQLVRAFNVAEVRREEDAIVVEGEHGYLSKLDRITVVRMELISTRLFDFEVAAVEVGDGRTTVTVSQSLAEMNNANYEKLSMAQAAIFAERHTPMSVPMAVLTVLLLSAGVGMFHGLSVTKLGMQPFIVTLCGLLMYRGLARRITMDVTQGFGTHYSDFKYVANGKPVYVSFLIMVIGGLMALWYGVRLLRQRQENPSAPYGLWPVGFGAGVGAALAVIGSAHLWRGFDFVEREMVVPGAEAVSTLDVAALPERLMVWFGAALILPGFVWLTVLALQRMRQRHRTVPVVASLIVTLLGGAVFLTSLLLNDAFTTTVTTPSFDILAISPYWLDHVDGVDALPQWKLALWWGGLIALLIGLTTFVTAAVTTVGKHARFPFAIFGVGMIIWLIGCTPIPQIRIPMPFIILLLLAFLSGVLLNRTIYGRYLMALGRNEDAARYSGIKTDRMIILAYVLCSLGAGISAILFAVDLNSIQPSGHGNFYELYAIAAAVLGGCSLRGGEGSILGVLVGVAVIRVIFNSTNMLELEPQLEFLILGAVIYVGVLADEVAKRIAARRRARREAQRAMGGGERECPACGYNLRGAQGPTCPECGAPIAATQTA